ncbi:MFS transporter [Emticicia sp. BO119]|uniref:MFS transporter n=1 Tax=Emticicia sp. BO119 TaxID=2757768 RepID=UPI0015F0702F|nr:MFS transporter [Emticicia sp. BO119]MBA4849342.1 MFS transporter [Emticicia sp. BO119]
MQPVEVNHSPLTTKNISRTEFIAMMACIELLTALAIDIMLPTFDAVRQEFHLGTESTATARLVTFFFFGQFFQLIFGPMADKYGRIPVIRAGFILYLSGCIATVLVPNMFWLLMARFIMGIGSSAMFVSVMACVRDRFAGNEMAHAMSMIFTIFLIVPVLAPLLGGFILSVSNWQTVFLTPAAFAIIIFIWSLRLSESSPSQQLSGANMLAVFQSFREVFSNKIFIRYTAISTILFAAFSSYVSSSERIVGTLYQQPHLFIYIFGAIGLCMSIFTFLNARLVGWLGAHHTLRLLLYIYVSLAILLLTLTIGSTEPIHLFVLFTIVGLLQSINIAIEPNSSSLALEPMGHKAGMAASIYGTSYLVVGAFGGSLIDAMLVHSVIPLTIAYFVGGVIALILFSTEQKKMRN